MGTPLQLPIEERWFNPGAGLPAALLREDDEDEPKTRTHVRGSEDSEQAEWLADDLDHMVLFNYSTKQWHVFDPVSGLWRVDDQRIVQERVDALARERLRVLSTMGNMGERERTKIGGVYRRLLTVAQVESALIALATRHDYKTNGNDMDADPNLLGCENGVVDLSASRLLPPDPSLRVSKSTGIRYVEMTEAEAQQGAKRLLLFLHEVTSGDPDLAEFYLRWFGYSLFGHTRAQKFLIMTGKLGRNGKGVLKRIMLHVFGEYAKELDRSLYSVSKFGPGDSSRPRADLMQLKGLRLAFLTEPEGRFDTDLLKAHSGGDPINARALRSNVQASWLPTHSIVFSANHPPAVSDVGLAIRDRVMVADFRERFTGKRQDQKLDDTLIGESEAILWLLVQHARLWDQGTDALDALPLPERVRDASDAYMTSNDPTDGYIEEGCVVGEDEKSAPRDLWRDYVLWFTDRHAGEDGFVPVPEYAFGIAIGSLFEKRGRPATWRGIRPKTGAELASEPA